MSATPTIRFEPYPNVPEGRMVLTNFRLPEIEQYGGVLLMGIGVALRVQAAPETSIEQQAQAQTFEARMLDLEGVVHVHLVDKYSVLVVKGPLFDWKAVEPGVGAVLLAYYNRTNETTLGPEQMAVEGATP